MSGYGQNNKTINTDTLFVRNIYFKDFANNPIPANQPLVSRGDGGTYFISSMTSTFTSPAVNEITASTPNGFYQYLPQGGHNTFSLIPGAGIQFYSNTDNGGLIVYNTGPEQIIADGQPLPFTSLPDYTIGGRTLQYVGTGDTYLTVSDATIFFNSAAVSSVSSIVYLESTNTGLIAEFSTLNGELNSTIAIVQSIYNSSAIGKFNLISSYFLTPNVINISTVSTSLLILGTNTIQDNSLKGSITDPCVVYVGNTPITTNTDFLKFKDNYSGVSFAIDKESLYASTINADNTRTITRGQQVQLGWFPTLSTQTNSGSLRAEFVPVIQQIQVIEQVVSTIYPYLSSVSSYYLKNIGKFDEICNPNKISLIAPVIGVTLRKDNLINNSWVQYDTVTSSIVWGENGGTGSLPTNSSNYGDYLLWNGTAWTVGFSTISIGDQAGGGAVTAEGQGEGAIAIGAAAGYSTQGAYSVAVGFHAGQYAQGEGSIAIGTVTGNSNQGLNAIAIGNGAGFFLQGEESIAIGDSAGYQQSTNGIAIGYYAGYSQGYNTIAIGTEAGYGYQNSNSVAIGNYAGGDIQDIESVAIGDSAGVTQSSFAVAIGYCAGTNNQNQGAIAIGSNAGSTIQGVSAVAIGTGAGQLNQSNNTIAIGNSAGNDTQGIYSVAIGELAGLSTQQSNAIAIGVNAGQNAQRERGIAIGDRAGFNNQQYAAIGIGKSAGRETQGAHSVAVGWHTARDNQGSNAVAIGFYTGETNQGSNSIALGSYAGRNSQSSESIAIGDNCGFNNQSSFSVAIGYQAGYQDQRNNAIAIGFNAGYNTQGLSAVAIGDNAGQNLQGEFAIAIGSNAGSNNQGEFAIAIGANAGVNSQSNASIVINATGQTLDTVQLSSFYVVPIRNDTGNTNALTYNAVTGEIIYDTTKTFVINHPKDDSKYLVHACLEGPEAGVYYRGTGTIAELETSIVVELPDYVDALATDLTIQVTPIYNGSIRVLNTSCVSNNKFTVYGDSGDFHWHVYGRRLAVDVEPKKSSVTVLGTGPYRWIA